VTLRLIKHEIRNPKRETNANAKCLNRWLGAFELLICFGIRVSYFEFPANRTLALPLLVAGIGAHYVHPTLAPDHLAVLANLLHAGADFHDTAHKESRQPGQSGRASRFGSGKATQYSGVVRGRTRAGGANLTGIGGCLANLVHPPKNSMTGGVTLAREGDRNAR
jgi:hypothetical protein